MWKINTDIVARLVMSALLFYAPFTWFTQQESVAAQMGRIQPDHGVILILVMTSLSISIMFEVLVNSLLSLKFKWSWGKAHRDTMYALGAFCSITVLFSVGKYALLRPGAVYIYILLFFFCLTMGVIDAHAKRPCRQLKKERREFIRE